mgnify:CR=1 FL=1
MWNANHVLDSALNPKTNGVPRGFFENCVGLILISVLEAGFIFSGNVGTGILIAKKDEKSWSPPSAIGLTGKCNHVKQTSVGASNAYTTKFSGRRWLGVNPGSVHEGCHGLYL